MILRNQTFVTHQNIYVGDIEISNNVISKITVKENMKPNFNQILLPGFIDIHTHGGYGFDFNNLINKKNELSFYLSNLVKEGVTSVIATTISCPEKDLNLIGKNIKNIINKSIIKGWHIEGPFISKDKKGAHNAQFIYPLNNKIVDFLKTLKFNLSLTIAPEVKDNLKYVSSLSKFASLSLGHSNASYDLSLKSFNLGIKRITHLYNQITPFHHRNLGIVNAAFDSQVTCELVCDLFHVKKQVINNTYKMIGADRLIVVSDSLSVKGLKNGFHSSQYMDIYKTSKVAYLKDKQTMAGSIQPYNEHLLNFIKSTNCGWIDLVKVSSYNASQLLKLNKVGDIKVGYIADLVLVNKNLKVLKTIIGGKLVK